MKPAAYLIYARRSSDTEDRQTLSIEQQLEELRRVAFTKGLDVAEELTESCSAREPGRPVFGELMKRVRNGEVGGILVWRLDRLARNMVDGGAVIYELSEGGLKEILTPEATYTGTADAKFMLSMLFGAAAKYTDDLSAAVRRGRRDAVEHGKVPGPVPLGYTKTHEHESARGAGIVIPDPERFELVKRVWREVLAGETNVSDVWRRAVEAGLTTRPTAKALARPVTLAQLYNLLRNPFYSGMVRLGSEIFKGEHPPIVTPDEFARVQELLGHVNHESKPAKHQFLYTGLMHCGACGRVLAGEVHEKHGHRYIYYRCTRRHPGFVECPEQAVTEEAVTDALVVTLDQVIVDPTIREWAFEAIAWWAGDDEPSPEKIVRRAKKALARAEHELETLTDLVVGGNLSTDEYTVRRANQLVKIDHLREALAKPAEKLEAWRSTRDEMKQNGLKLGDEFRNGDDERRRKIVARTCEDVVVIDRNPHAKLRTPFMLRVGPPVFKSGLTQPAIPNLGAASLG